jgi:hypothetical protein
VHQGNPDHRDGEQLARQIDFLDQICVENHGSGGITEDLVEEVDRHDAREQIDGVRLGPFVQVEKDAHGDVEHQELHAGLDVTPHDAEHRPAVADAQLLADQ